MNIENLTSNTIFLWSSEYKLEPVGQLFVPDSIYLGNERIYSAVNNLFLNGMILVTETKAPVITGEDNDFLEE